MNSEDKIFEDVDINSENESTIETITSADDASNIVEVESVNKEDIESDNNEAIVSDINEEISKVEEIKPLENDNTNTDSDIINEENSSVEEAPAEETGEIDLSSLLGANNNEDYVKIFDIQKSIFENLDKDVSDLKTVVSDIEDYNVETNEKINALCKYIDENDKNVKEIYKTFTFMITACFFISILSVIIGIILVFIK